MQSQDRFLRDQLIGHYCLIRFQGQGQADAAERVCGEIHFLCSFYLASGLDILIILSEKESDLSDEKMSYWQ